MAVIIGSARIDENGRAHGGAAGDQTKNELSTQNWYASSKVWRVFRPIDPAKAEKIAWAMQAACDNQNIGYDQYQRLTLYNAVKNQGFNPAKATSPVETDCSALVRVCCAYAGIMLENFTTPGEPEILLKSGAFKEMVGSKYSNSSLYLKRGDILCTSTQGHTVVVLSNGSKANAEEDIPDTEARVVIKTGTWHVRTEANKNSTSVAIVKGGDKLIYLGINSNGWLKVIYNGAERWISEKAVASYTTNALKYVHVVGSWHVRKSPSAKGTDMGVVGNGTRLQYQGEEQNGWWLVIYKNQNGWISGKSGYIE